MFYSIRTFSSSKLGAATIWLGNPLRIFSLHRYSHIIKIVRWRTILHTDYHFQGTLEVYQKTNKQKTYFKEKSVQMPWKRTVSFLKLVALAHDVAWVGLTAQRSSELPHSPLLCRLLSLSGLDKAGVCTSGQTTFYYFHVAQIPCGLAWQEETQTE